MPSTRPWFPGGLPAPRATAIAITTLLAAGSLTGIAIASEQDVNPLPDAPSVAKITVELDGLRRDAATLAEQHGVSVDTMHEYLLEQERLNAVAPKVEEAAGARLAGLWIDWQPAPVLIVSMTGNTEDSRVTEALGSVSSSSEVRYGAAYSRAELLDELDRLASSGLRSRIPSATGHYLDEPNNQIVITLADSSAESARSVPAITGLLTDLSVPHEFVFDGGPAAPANRGGRHLSSCTSGFTVYHPSTNTHGYLTAGHCGPTQNYMWWSDLSWRETAFVDERWNASVDVQWHRVDPATQAVAPLFHVAKTTAYQQAGTTTVVPGSQVCNWGSRSLTSNCGTVTSLNYAPTVCGPTEGPCNNTFIRVSTGSGHMCKGDSGGPVYIGPSAVGILSGGGPFDGQCLTGTSRWIYVNPINTALGLLGLALYTS